MSDDRLRQLRQGFADDAYQGDEPPDLSPLRALADGEELAVAAGHLADACGRRLPEDNPLMPLARDLARALTEAGFTLRRCAPGEPPRRPGEGCPGPGRRAPYPGDRGGGFWREGAHGP